jgi:hypothetical protein
MRTLRLSLVGPVILALLGGLGGAVLAQADDDRPVTATYVTGQQTDAREVDGGGYARVGGIGQYHGAVYEDTLEWSDPRLSSSMWIAENLDMHDLGDGSEAWTWVGSIRLKDEEGAWTGREYGMGEFMDDGLVLRPRVMMLSGDGAYEGLTAVFQRSWDPDDPTYHVTVEGYIHEGELPPMPDPVEPPVE